MGGLSAVRQELIAHLKRLLPQSFWTIVSDSSAQATLLDIIGVYKGHYITIAVLADGSQLTSHQRIVALMQENCGAIVLKFERNDIFTLKNQAQLLALKIKQEVAEKERQTHNGYGC